MIADRLKLIDDKTEFMITGTRVQLDKVNVCEIVKYKGRQNDECLSIYLIVELSRARGARSGAPWVTNLVNYPSEKIWLVGSVSSFINFL